MKYRFLFVLLGLFLLSTVSLAQNLTQQKPAVTQGVNVPILLYHRLGPTVADGMTMKTSVFEEHLKYLRDNGYKVIPLRQLVDWYQKKGPAPAAKSVVIVEDDGSGFNVNAPRDTGHLGLVGMHERVEMLGGTLTLESVPGRGTTVFAEVPYAHADLDRG